MSLKICQIGQESFTSDLEVSTTKRISSHLDGSVLGSAIKTVHKQYFSSRCSGEYFKNKATQTDYRDSESQTLPWEPAYKVADGHNPEVLTLLSFTWGDGLPAGMHEIEIINRMRMRRAWEKVLPPIDTPCNIKKRSAIIAALEADEWAFREAEIQMIMDLRMELAEELMESREKEKRQRTESRFEKLEEMLKKRKQKEVKNIKNKLSRELRKLINKHKYRMANNNKRQHKKGFIETFADADMYHDDKPRYDCSRVLKKLREDNEYVDYVGLNSENEDKCPKWLYDTLNESKRESTSICGRFVERNEKHLLKLSKAYESDRDYIRLSDACSLLKRKPKPRSLPSTPRISWPSENAEDVTETAVKYLQCLIEGRAVQSKFHIETNRCKDLVDELQASQYDSEKEWQRKLERDKEEIIVAQENKAKEILQALEGKTIAKMLMFLNKELTRLESEKKNHALVLLAERERMQKKIEQACQEKLESNRRREVDEIYRQILKVNQESVQLYLEDVIKEGIEWSSEKEAEKYVLELSDKIDAMAKYMDENMDKIDEEGMVADMVYNFVLPLVAKESVNQQQESQENEESYLRAAHAAIYDEMLDIARNELFAETAATDSLDRSNLTYTAEREDFWQSGEEVKADKKMESDDVLPQVIELILDYTPIADEGRKQEVYIILEEMLWIAKEKLSILN